jgi:hypothetical protein
MAFSHRCAPQRLGNKGTVSIHRLITRNQSEGGGTRPVEKAV